MVTAMELLANALRELEADGLVNPGAECGCPIEEIGGYCDGVDLRRCVPAREVDPPQWARLEGYQRWFVPMGEK